jgi:hypothetical protein
MQANFDGMIPIFTVTCLALLPLANRFLAGETGSLLRELGAELKSNPHTCAVFLLGLQLIFALLISITYGRTGSGVHYFLEWNLICCPLAGMLLAGTLSEWRESRRLSMGGAAVTLLLLLAALTGVEDSLRRIDGVYRLSGGERRMQAARDSSSAAALKVLKATPGPALSDNLLLLMEAHKEIPIEPGIEMYLGKAGIWDQSAFVEMIATRKFGVIVMRTIDNGFWTDEIVKAIKDHYVVAQKIGDESIDECHYTVYRPRP